MRSWHFGGLSGAEDHADVAAEASVAMLFALEVLQAEFSKRNYPWKI